MTKESEVQRYFSGLNPSKAAGPDKIRTRVLNVCASQLAKIFTHIFNLSFSTCSVPEVWKTSCIIPVPKKSPVTCMNDLRPVALTSIAMKVCERILLKEFSTMAAPYLDQFQFAYQNNRSTEDAILVLLEKVYKHLERAKFGNSVRITFLLYYQFIF